MGSGKDVAAFERQRTEDFGLIPQHPVLLPEFDTRCNLTWDIFGYGTPDQRKKSGKNGQYVS
jgi:hypothetical protein